MIAPSIRHRTAARGRSDRWLAGTTVTVALASLPAIIRIVRTIPLRVSLDTNEGWNAYQAVAAFAGGLYPHAPRFFFNNYPPLSFYLVGLAGRWTGDPIVAGRLIACAAFAALAVMLGLVATDAMHEKRSHVRGRVVRRDDAVAQSLCGHRRSAVSRTGDRGRESAVRHSGAAHAA